MYIASIYHTRNLPTKNIKCFFIRNSFAFTNILYDVTAYYATILQIFGIFHHTVDERIYNILCIPTSVIVD